MVEPAHDSKKTQLSFLLRSITLSNIIITNIVIIHNIITQTHFLQLNDGTLKNAIAKLTGCSVKHTISQMETDSKSKFQIHRRLETVLEGLERGFLWHNLFHLPSWREVGWRRRAAGSVDSFHWRLRGASVITRRKRTFTL